MNTPPSLAAESVSRAQPGKVQIGDFGRTLRPLVNHAGWSGDEFLKGTRRSWRPTLLIRANDEQAAVSAAGLEAEVETETASVPTAQSDWSGLEGDPNSELETKWQWNLDQRSISDRNRSRWERVKSDYANFYSSKSMLQMGTAFLAGAAMANTNFDEMFSHDLYRDNVIDIANEDISQTLHQPKLLGDGYILLPTLAALALAEPWLEQSEWTKPLGEWGDRGARAILVGGPVVLLTQNLTAPRGRTNPPRVRIGNLFRTITESAGTLLSAPFLS